MMNHKKQKHDILKRASTWLLSLLMITNSFLNTANIKAASVGTVSLGRQIPYSYNVTGSDGYNEYAAVTNEILADGEIAFCIQPGHVLIPGTGFDKTDYTIPEQRMLSIISYEGWDTSSKTPEDFLATQLYIWEYMGGRINSTTLPNWASRKAQIANKIAKHDTRPSFNGKNITLNVGESITLTDTNNVFSQFNLKSNDGLKVSKSGNKLTITATANAKDNSKIIYNKIPDKYIGTSILYRNGSQDVSKLYLSDPLPTFINVRVNKYGSLNITKQDEDGNNVPNTTFKLSKNSDMSSPVGTYTTGGNGQVLINQLLPGNYFVQETAVPSHLVLDSTIRSVTIKPSETTSYVARNNWVKGKIAIRKTDTESGKQVAGATYAIFNNQNQELQRLVTTATGYADSGYLRFGSYYVKEVIAPNGYVLNDTKYPVTISTNEQKIDVTGNDVRVKGSINITKEDSITGNQPQGQGTSLAGAVYELRARQPILDPADKSVLFAKDAVVATLTTDNQAKASINDLYLGDYYLKEVKPSPGYTLDTIEYEVPVHYAGQNVPVVTKSQTVKERVISQAFSIIKISDNDNGEADLLKGVEFTVKAKPDVDKLGWDKAPIAKNAQGQDAAVLVTDAKGYAVSDELPIGSYVVRETKTPDNHYTVPDFTVTVTTDSREPQPWRIFNDKKFKAVVAIVKQDAETGKTVALPGATFKIKNTDTGEYVSFWKWNPLPTYVNSWTTNETGTVFTDDVLTYGNYELIETKAPEGYTISTAPIQFKIDMNGAMQTLPGGKTPVITVIQKDTSVKGKITVSKEGEVLTSTSTDDKGNLAFHYEKQKLANAVFEVYARENIMSADNQGDILYKKGELIQNLTTNAGGTATTKDLPLGKYQVKEKTAPDGFTHSEAAKDVDLTYKDQDTAVVFNSTSYLNDRQKVSIKLVKKDADTQTPLQGAIFGLSADEDIYTPDHKLLVKKGALIEMSISDEKGNVSFKADLPLSKYVVKELTPPVGYSSSDAVLNIDASYQGQDVKTITYKKDVLNKITKTEISKVDITDNSEIEGASLVVYPQGQPGAIFDSWISGQDGKNEDGTIKPHMIKGLEPGKTYVLHEVSSPYGFSLAKDVEFTVKDTGDMQKVTMQDKPVEGQLKWNKTGEIFNQTLTGQNEFGTTLSPVWNKSNILGAEITIYAAQDIKIGNKTYYKTDEAVQTLESDWDAVLSKKLPVGKYYYKETKIPMGYLTNTDKHYFEVKDNQITDLQTIESTLDNPRPTFDVDMTKVMEQQDVFKNPEAYKDVLFGIYAREDIYDYKGDVAIENGTMISTSGIDEKGHLINVPDLPNGVYFIKELATNEQYVLDKNEYDFEISYHGADVAKYIIQIGTDGKIDNELIRGTVQVQKKDSSDDKKILKDVAFNISADPDMKDIIKTEKTDDTGITSFNDLERGVYYIQEAKQVDNYVVNDHIYKVEVKEDGDFLTIECDNKPVEIEFSKLGETGTEQLPGATMQVTDKETGKVVDEWVTGKDVHARKYLVEGRTYIYKEVKAPTGYEVAKPIEFIAKDGLKITMKDKKIRSYIKVNKVDYYNHKDVLKVAEFTLYEDEACTKPIKTAKTDVKNGVALFDGLTFNTYYIKETKAPAGYQLSKEVIKVVIDDKWVNGNDKTRTIIFPDKPLPAAGGVATGDDTDLAGWIVLLITSISGIVLIRRRKYEER